MKESGVKRSFIVFSGSNERAVVAFCRTLNSLKQPFHIIARTKSDPIFMTSYRKYVSAVRSRHELDLEEIDVCIKNIRANSGVDHFVICPSSEYLNLFLLRNRDFFDSRGCHLPLVSREQYEILTHKYSFTGLCEKHDIPVPARLEDYRRGALPFVARPIRNVNREHKSLYPYLIHNEGELRYFEKREKPGEYFYQEFVPGDSYYLLFFVSSSGAVLKCSQQNIIQQWGGKSIVMARSSELHEHPMMENFVTLLRSVSFQGLAMIEVKRWNNTYVAIELNPRLWGPLQLVTDVGSPVVEAFIAEATGGIPGVANSRPVHKKATYLWLSGILGDTFRGKRLSWYGRRPRYPLHYIAKNLRHDIYLRSDTIALFFHELYQCWKENKTRGPETGTTDHAGIEESITETLQGQH